MEKQVTSKIKDLNETNSLDPRLEYPRNHPAARKSTILQPKFGGQNGETLNDFR